jgi:formylmethanofuran dehydrogenase subunit E
VEKEVDDEDVVIAAKLHGHLSAGVALGIRMGQIGLKRLKLSKGDKRLFAVVETSLCLADGIQASTGCTPGHASLHIEDFGKLAACLARSDTKTGVRIVLKHDVQSPSVKDWMMRKAKLNHQMEEELVKELLHLDESFFLIEEVIIEPFYKFDNSEIVHCSRCKEPLTESKAVKRRGKTLCKACSNMKYYTEKPIFSNR